MKSVGAEVNWGVRFNDDVDVGLLCVIVDFVYLIAIIFSYFTSFVC